MRRLKTLAAVTLLALLPACESPVPSLHPLFTSEEAVEVPAVLGLWAETQEDPESLPDATWRFEKTGKSEYRLTIRDNDQKYTDIFDVRLGEIGGYLFLDVVLRERHSNGQRLDPDDYWIPAHLFGRIWIERDELHIRLLEDEWLEKALESGRVELAHEKTEGGVVLTAPSTRLQEFALRYAWDEEPFCLKFDLVRWEEAASPQPPPRN